MTKNAAYTLIFAHHDFVFNGRHWVFAIVNGVPRLWDSPIVAGEQCT